MVHSFADLIWQGPIGADTEHNLYVCILFRGTKVGQANQGYESRTIFSIKLTSKVKCTEHGYKCGKLMQLVR